jgi:hypothetical protein
LISVYPEARRRLVIDGNNASARSESNEFNLCVKVEFVHQVGTVSFGSTGAYPKSPGDLSTGQSFSGQMQDFLLTGSQCFVPI